jgi:hypothetical protein
LTLAARLARFAFSTLTARLTLLTLSALTARFAFGALAARLALFTRFAVHVFAAFTGFDAFALAICAETRTAAATTAAAFALIALPIGLLKLGVRSLVTLGARLGLLAVLGFERGLVVALTVEIGTLVEAIGLRRLHRDGRLHRTPQAEVVIGVLEIILAQNAIAGAARVAGKLQVPLMDE